MINLQHSLRHVKNGVGDLEHHLLKIELCNIRIRKKAKPLVPLGKGYTRAFHTCSLFTVPLINRPFITVEPNGTRVSNEVLMAAYFEQESARMTYDKMGVNMRAKWFV